MDNLNSKLRYERSRKLRNKNQWRNITYATIIALQFYQCYILVAFSAETSSHKTEQYKAFRERKERHV